MSNYLLQEAGRFKALSNPHRLALFQRLITCCAPGTTCDPVQAAKVCVGELGEGLDIAPSTLSHHLKTLHAAGLINMQRRGKHIDCWLDPAVLKQLAGFFTGPDEVNT